MAERMDSYCGIVYVDTEAESLDGHYPVGPHPYETCLFRQHQKLADAIRVVEKLRADVERLGERIYKRDHPIVPRTRSSKPTA